MLITQGHVLEARYNYLGWVKIKKSVTAADEESPEVRSSVILNINIAKGPTIQCRSAARRAA